MICEQPDFIFPLVVDVYYPLVDQSAYGNVKKTWVLDKTIACAFNNPVSKTKEEIKPNVAITIDNVLTGRTKTDVRFSNREDSNAITNVVLSNIRDRFGKEIYVETSGPRTGKSTIFEIATNNPVVGPFGTVEYYQLVLRRSENQAVDL